MKNRQILLASAVAGALGAALLCSAGIAQAQGYYGERGDYYSAPPETVIVRPEYGVVQKHQILGHVDGSVNPTILTLSQPVNYSDLDLSRPSDRRELRHRISATAEDVCAELDVRYSGYGGDEDEYNGCVHQAIRDAMRQLE